MTFESVGARCRFFAMLLMFLSGCFLQGCYSFKGISIPEGANTFFVANFQDVSDLQLPNYDVNFTELLKDKIRDESRLKWNDAEPDIEFKGRILGFEVSSVAPEAGAVSAFNRLEVTIEVTYVNHVDSESGWTKRFSQFDNFDANQNLLEALPGILPGINQLLLDYIFNAAFTDW
jgi:hypothetical protein